MMGQASSRLSIDRKWRPVVDKIVSATATLPGVESVTSEALTTEELVVVLRLAGIRAELNRSVAVVLELAEAWRGP